MASGQQNTLRGWKEIATYVGRDVRTVQRWEDRRGFPVRRLPGGERGNVYALAPEVDEWLHPSKTQPAEEGELASAVPVFASPAPVAPFSTYPSGVEAATVDPSLTEPAFDPASRESFVQANFARHPLTRFGVGLGALAAALALATLGFFRFQQERVQARGTPSQAGPLEHYASPVAGVDELYLQGMYLFEKRTPESLTDAKRVLLDVTARDPKDALAWAGLAQTYVLLCAYGVETDADAGCKGRARAAAQRAVALDPGLAEPHAVLGFAEFFWEGNVKGAEPEFRTALRINPSSAMARSWYGTLLTYEGRYPEALEQLNRAQRLQPASTAILSNRALALGLSGHREEAFQLLDQAGKENMIAGARFNLAVLSLVRPCKADVYLREEMELATLSHSDASFRVYAAAQEAYRRGGEQAMWRSILLNGEREHMAPDLLAGAHAALGENEAAFEVLAKAEKESSLPMYVSMNPLLQPLRHDPRFKRFLSAEGFPPVS